mgnify:CR=1 FL=1
MDDLKQQFGDDLREVGRWPRFLQGGQVVVLQPLGGSSDLAEMVNYNPLFLERAEQCKEEGEALPNFVAVDYYDIGDLFDVTQSLNSR